VVLESREAVAPEVSGALVAMVDLLCVGQVHACDGWEVFRRGCEGGQYGGAGANADIEKLWKAVISTGPGV
jgi:hypothetical protein